MFIQKELSYTVSEIATKSPQGVKKKNIAQGAGEILTKNLLKKILEQN